jgi:hypothetical protein
MIKVLSWLIPGKEYIFQNIWSIPGNHMVYICVMSRVGVQLENLVQQLSNNVQRRNPTRFFNFLVHSFTLFWIGLHGSIMVCFVP